MSPRDLILDFLNLIFLILLIVFCIFYFITGDNFAVFSLFLKSMVPLAFFGILFLVQLKITRNKIKEMKSEDKTELVLYLNVFDKLISDIVVFCTPILMGLLIYQSKGFLEIIDIIFLSIIFLIMFFWQKYLFSKVK
jgi:predicted Na+-dependent transporter